MGHEWLPIGNGSLHLSAFQEHCIAVTLLFSIFWIHGSVLEHLMESLFYLFRSQEYCINRITAVRAEQSF